MVRHNPGVQSPEHPSRPTVVFVTPRSGGGGANQSLRALLTALHDVHRVVAAPSGFIVDPSQVDESVVIAPGPAPGRLERTKAAWRLLRWGWRHRRTIAVIHANGVSALNMVGPVAWLTRRPVVVWAHASRWSDVSVRTSRFWAKRLPRLRWVAVSEASRQLLVDSGLAPLQDIAIVPNPIGDDKLAPRRVPDGVTVAYLSGPATYKGFHVVPAVVALTRHLGVRWFIVTGSGGAAAANPIIAQLESLAGPDVELSGWVSNVATAYAHTNIVFCPSFRESFGRIAAEAMANGLPVVASDIPAFRELLGDGEAGILYPPGDAAAAAAAIGRLAHDAKWRDELGAAGRRRAEDFSPGSVAAAFRSMYGLPTAAP